MTRDAFWWTTSCSRTRDPREPTACLFMLCSLRVDCRARIFEICSQSKTVAFEVSDPGGHRATRRGGVQDGLHGRSKGWSSTPAALCNPATLVGPVGPLPTFPMRVATRLEEYHHDHDHSPSRPAPTRSPSPVTSESCWTSEPCYTRLRTVRSIHGASATSRRTRAEASVGRREAPRANPSQHAPTPCNTLSGWSYGDGTRADKRGRSHVPDYSRGRDLPHGPRLRVRRPAAWTSSFAVRSYLL